MGARAGSKPKEKPAFSTVDLLHLYLHDKRSLYKAAWYDLTVRDMAVKDPAISGVRGLWDSICTRDWKNNQIKGTD